VTVRTYDDFDRVKSELVPLEDGSSWQIRYTYWRDGLRKTMTDMVGRVTYYEYDGQARLERVTANQGLPEQQVTAYTYWPDDLLKTITAPNGVVTSYDYDRADRVKSIVIARDGVTLASYAYTYDPNGNRLSQIETTGGAPELTTYTYDARDRLSRVTYPSGASVEYVYDRVSNRTGEIERDPAGTIVSNKVAVFDAINRLTSVTDSAAPANDATFTYDANGNLTSKTTAAGTETYNYDPRDLMVEARKGTEIVARYAYDAFGRRYLKVSSEGAFTSVVRQYLYDQTSLLHELDSDDLEVAKYEYGGDRLASLVRPRRAAAVLSPGRARVRRRAVRFRRRGRRAVPPGRVGALSRAVGARRVREPLRLHGLPVRPGDRALLREGALLRSRVRAVHVAGLGAGRDQRAAEPASVFLRLREPLRFVDPTGHAPEERYLDNLIDPSTGHLVALAHREEVTVRALMGPSDVQALIDAKQIGREEAVLRSVGANPIVQLAAEDPEFLKSTERLRWEAGAKSIAADVSAPMLHMMHGAYTNDGGEFAWGFGETVLSAGGELSSARRSVGLARPLLPKCPSSGCTWAEPTPLNPQAPLGLPRGSGSPTPLTVTEPATSGAVSVEPVARDPGIRERVLANIAESQRARMSSNVAVLAAKDSQIASGYNPDVWTMGVIQEGSIVYGGYPGQTAFLHQRRDCQGRFPECASGVRLATGRTQPSPGSEASTQGL
jgi:YD repeat-containing protein